MVLLTWEVGMYCCENETGMPCTLLENLHMPLLHFLEMGINYLVSNGGHDFSYPMDKLHAQLGEKH